MGVGIVDSIQLECQSWRGDGTSKKCKHNMTAWVVGGAQLHGLLSRQGVAHIAATPNVEGSAQGPSNPSTYTG